MVLLARCGAVGASGGGNIMYADESSDLTDEVLKGLNAQYDKKK